MCSSMMDFYKEMQSILIENQQTLNKFYDHKHPHTLRIPSV